MFSNGHSVTSQHDNSQDWSQESGQNRTKPSAGQYGSSFVRSGISEYSLAAGQNGYSKNNKDLDTISTSSSVMSSNVTTNANQMSNGSTNGGIHMNGMQTLPLVRGGSNQAANDNAPNQDSPKHAVNGASAANGVASTSTASNGPKPKFMVATPEQVMKLYMSKLTPYEHHEIFNYPQIYFIGANAKKRPGIIGGPNNCGYDDEQARVLFGIWHCQDAK